LLDRNGRGQGHSGGGFFELDSLRGSKAIADCFIDFGNFFNFLWVASGVDEAQMSCYFVVQGVAERLKEVSALLQLTEASMSH